MSIQPFEIPARSRRCSIGQEEFEQNMPYYSLLEQKDTDEYLRKDMCESCWKKEEPAHSRKIFWKSRVPSKADTSPAVIQREQKALSLLREWLQTDDSNNEPFIFVLTLYLARNKVLRFLRDLDEKAMLYEVVETEEILCINKVQLSSIQAEEVRKILADKLAAAS